jgi:small-conductance mechanosensitive channel
MAEFIDSINVAVPAEFLGPMAFVLWLVVLWILKNFILFRLKRWAQKTKAHWDDVFVDILAGTLSLPIDLLILSSGLVILADFAGLPDRFERLAVVVFQGCIVLSCILAADRVLLLMVSRYGKKGALSHMSQGIVRGLLRGFVIGIGILIFLDLLGISITPLLASLGIGSLAVALALQDTLSNFFAGLYISVDRPVEVGHFVKLESGQEGYVVDVGWRSTRIRMLSGSVVVVPNAKLMGSVITNYYLPDPEVAVLVEMGVAFESDLEKVERVVGEIGREVQKTTQGAVPDFEPFIRYHTFGEYSIGFTVILRAKEFVDNYLVKHEFIKKVLPRFRREGIEIPYPTRKTLNETVSE